MDTESKIKKYEKKAVPLIRQVLAAGKGLSANFYFTGNKEFDNAALILSRRIDDSYQV